MHVVVSSMTPSQGALCSTFIKKVLGSEATISSSVSSGGKPDILVLADGPDPSAFWERRNPETFASSPDAFLLDLKQFNLIRWCLANDISMLGFGRGCELLNWVFGGKTEKPTNGKPNFGVSVAHTWNYGFSGFDGQGSAGAAVISSLSKKFPNFSFNRYWNRPLSPHMPDRGAILAWGPGNFMDRYPEILVWNNRKALGFHCSPESSGSDQDADIVRCLIDLTIYPIHKKES